MRPLAQALLGKKKVLKQNFSLSIQILTDRVHAAGSLLFLFDPMGKYVSIAQKAEATARSFEFAGVC